MVLFSVHTNRLLSEVKKNYIIIIPALFVEMSVALKKNRKLIPWIVEQYKNGAEDASLCEGAFLLASTGLLSGKKFSTHCGFINEFNRMFPDVEVVAGTVLTEEKRIYSSGGANSYWNLLLHLVEKYTNRETAIMASKYFAVDIDRFNQSAFSMFKGQKDHKDEDVKKAQEYIEKNKQEKISVDYLASNSSVRRRNFERRFRQATHNSVLEYIQRVKIEAAKRQFEMSRKNITEVMYDFGNTDNKSFRDLFKKITGLTPIGYRSKY